MASSFARGAQVRVHKGQVWCHGEAVLAWQGRTAGCRSNPDDAHRRGGRGSPPSNLEDGRARIRRNSRGRCGKSATTASSPAAIPPSTVRPLPRHLTKWRSSFTGPATYLHSRGMFGRQAFQPAKTCCASCSSTLRERTPPARSTSPASTMGADVTFQEREMWTQIPFNEREYVDELGLASRTGEAGFSVLEQRGPAGRWENQRADIMVTRRRAPMTVIPTRAVGQGLDGALCPITRIPRRYQAGLTRTTVRRALSEDVKNSSSSQSTDSRPGRE